MSTFRAVSIPIVVSMLALAGCAENGPSGDGGSAVIVTTTSVAPSVPTSEPSTPPDPTTTDATAATTEPSTTEPSTTEPSTIEPSTTEPVVGDPSVSLVEVARFERPVDLVDRPGDELYVVEQSGAIMRWTGDGADVALDLTGRISDGGEQGVLGVAFSPDGATAYVDFTDRDGTTTIAEYAVLTDGTFDPSTERILLTVDQPYSNHNAGDLDVDAAGMLYVTLGDGGSGGDPERRASDPTSLLGSLLRIDPRPGDGRPYSIPADNPFASGPLELADGTTIDGAPEVLAWGLRNPWKIAFDPVNGDLWIADVGQNEIEEVNVVGSDGVHPAGWAHDFGWSAFEGDERFNQDVPDSGRTTPPVLTYRHDDGNCSVSGGVPYRGSAVPGLAPAYVYADYCSGTLWALDVAGVRNLVLATGLDQVTAVRADGDGELYVLQASGAVLALRPT